MRGRSHLLLMPNHPDGVCLRHDMGRGPLHYDTSTTRYGVQQRNVPDRESDGWYAGWPAYATREQALESFRYFEEGELARHPRKYEFRIVVYPPEPPPFARRLEIG